MVAGEWCVRDRRLARADEHELAATAPVEAERLWRAPRRDRPAHRSSRREADDGRHRAKAAWRSTCRTSTRSARGWSTSSSRRSGASRPSGRRRAGSSARRRCRWRRSPRSPSAIKVGSGVVNNWTRNVGLLAATFSTLDDLAPGRDHARDRRVVGPARREGRHPPRAGRCRRCARRSRCVRRLLAMERVTFHGEFVDLDDVEIDIVHGDRSPKDVPIYIGATGMKMMELAGEIADGVVLNYLVGPGYNREAMERLASGAARAGRTVDDIDRPQLVVCSLDDDRDARARPRARARHPVPRPAAAHHEGERRRPGAARGDRRDPHLAGRRTSRSTRRCSSCPTRSSR